MADPFSVVAGVAGVATAGVGLACSLFRIAEDLKSAADDINLFAEEVSSFWSVMEFAHESLSTHYLKSSNSCLMNKITGLNGVLRVMTRQSSLIMSRIRDVKRTLRSFQEDINIIARFKWLVKRHSVGNLRMAISNAKSDMNIIMTSLLLNELINRHEADSNKIQRLTREIRNLTIGAERRQYRNRIQHGPNEDMTRKENALQLALLEIAKCTIKETEEYFEVGRAVTVPKPLRTRRGYRCLKFRNPVPEVYDTQPSSLPLDIISRQFKSESLGSQVSSNQHSSRSCSAIVGGNEAQSALQPPEDDNEKSSSEPREQLQYTSVSPTDYFLDLDNLHDREALSGYIGSAFVNAKIAPGFQNNLMSINFVLDHDLIVQPSGKGDEINWFNFGNGTKEPVVGVVKFKWRESIQPGVRDFIVWCSVCRHNFMPLIFGEPFIRKRLKYSRSSAKGEPFRLTIGKK